MLDDKCSISITVQGVKHFIVKLPPVAGLLRTGRLKDLVFPGTLNPHRGDLTRRKMYKVVVVV